MEGGWASSDKLPTTTTTISQHTRGLSPNLLSSSHLGLQFRGSSMFLTRSTISRRLSLRSPKKADGSLGSNRAASFTRPEMGPLPTAATEGGHPNSAPSQCPLWLLACIFRGSDDPRQILVIGSRRILSHVSLSSVCKPSHGLGWEHSVSRAGFCIYTIQTRCLFVQDSASQVTGGEDLVSRAAIGMFTMPTRTLTRWN
jgi:hypothetical protein